MRAIVYISFITFFLAIFGCSNKQAGQQTSIDSSTVEEDGIIDDYDEDEYVSYVPSINIFGSEPIDSLNVIFISLSDIYSLSEHPDSIAVPIIEEKGFDKSLYMKLESKYREQFLSKTGILPTDSVFVYDYTTNSLAAFLVKDLNVMANVSPYVGSDDWPLLQYDYMIGFEVDQKKLKGFGDHLYNLLVCVGKENPFAQEQLTPITWNKIASDKYPSKEIKEEYTPYLADLIVGDTYLFETDSLQFYLQNYHTDEERNYYDTLRRLLVVESRTKDIIIEKLFGRDQDTSPSPLNYEDNYENEDEVINQWMGKLFKDKAPVVFGFEYISFGCPYISVLDRSNEDIYLQCDNRH